MHRAVRLTMEEMTPKLIKISSLPHVKKLPESRLVGLGQREPDT